MSRTRVAGAALDASPETSEGRFNVENVTPGAHRITVAESPSASRIRERLDLGPALGHRSLPGDELALSLEPEAPWIGQHVVLRWSGDRRDVADLCYPLLEGERHLPRALTGSRSFWDPR